MTHNKDPLLNTFEAANYLQLNPRSLTNQRSRGEGPAYVKIGSLVRYKTSALDRYIEAGEVNPGGQAA